MKPFVNYRFDVRPRTFEQGAVQDLVGKLVTYEGEVAFVESAQQVDASTADLVIKPYKKEN